MRSVLESLPSLHNQQFGLLELILHLNCEGIPRRGDCVARLLLTEFNQIFFGHAHHHHAVITNGFHVMQ